MHVVAKIRKTAYFFSDTIYGHKCSRISDLGNWERKLDAWDIGRGVVLISTIFSITIGE